MDMTRYEQLLQVSYPNVDRMIGVTAAAMAFLGVLRYDHNTAARARAALEVYAVPETSRTAQELGHGIDTTHIWQEATRMHLAQWLDFGEHYTAP